MDLLEVLREGHEGHFDMLHLPIIRRNGANSDLSKQAPNGNKDEAEGNLIGNRTNGEHCGLGAFVHFNDNTATASMVDFYKKFHRKRTLSCFKDIPSNENSNFLGLNTLRTLTVFKNLFRIHLRGMVSSAQGTKLKIRRYFITTKIYVGILN